MYYCKGLTVKEPSNKKIPEKLPTLIRSLRIRNAVKEKIKWKSMILINFVTSFDWKYFIILFSSLISMGLFFPMT